MRPSITGIVCGIMCTGVRDIEDFVLIKIATGLLLGIGDGWAIVHGIHWLDRADDGTRVDYDLRSRREPRQ